MTIRVSGDYVDIYMQGFLDQALNTDAKHTTLEKWDDYLNTQPVCNFINTEDWSLDPETGEIVYKIEEPREEQDRLKVTAQIINDEEHLLHSIDSPSFFFRVEDNDRLTALYVD